jgi:hypothetical protein
LTFEFMNKRIISAAPGRPLLPFGLDPSTPLLPGSLFGQEAPEAPVPAPTETPAPSP